MTPKSLMLTLGLILCSLSASSQYTEKINSNRPGTSQGAFSVGNNVLQLEGGLGLARRKHDILKTKTGEFDFDYQIRYGLLFEQLEISLSGRFRSDRIKQTVGANEEVYNQTNFEYNTLGAKYLIYDPYKRPKKDSIDLNSWRAQHSFKWKSLIPAVSVYAGANLISADNPFTAPGDEGFSPKVVIATQNNWYNRTNGSWVLVSNLIFDKITTDDMVIGWVITSTHTLNRKWAIFGEYQGQKSDFYSDDILRLGGAYLMDKDLQFDANLAFNFKDTPSIWKVSFGATYRFDWHSKDEIIYPKGFKKGVQKEEEEKDKKKKKDKDSEDLEINEKENDSLKMDKTPFINEFEDDDYFREEMDQELDSIRTELRLERERIEAEKIAEKENKKKAKEERRRLKREAKEARQAEKAKEKAEKEKQKMLEDIDAELNKMEENDGTDKELDQLEKEIKALEQKVDVPSAKPDDPKKEQKQEEDVDAQYEKLKEEQERKAKEAEKAKKEEEKRRKKEEKRRKKEEEKRKKKEDKDSGKDNDGTDNND
ncbi:outer membrane putative beta-barrel porin/alpha-amylase [Aquimarina brevivitae]|uniref:Outer membrane putative beta-barrel porin/alpha-amylase n=2 Tax=Aquimarina brevivitae TaxID=323412 RepID=A0A4Q7P2N4_9FLAO|nr:outer membrane putative beta-barrel porin/alpha-amylase [Aquimarina brevivitae]